MRLLDRYLLRQLILPLLVGVAVFVVILLAEVALRLGDALLGARVSALLIAQYFALCVPRAFSWSLPVGVLVGAAMTCTALARNGEITAARVGGAAYQRLWLPFVVVGLVCSGVSFAVDEFLVPGANQRADEVMSHMTHLQPVLRPRGDQTFRQQDGRILYVGHMDAKSGRLDQVMVLDENPAGVLTGLTFARWAEVRDDRWVLREGVTVAVSPDGEPTGQPAPFATREVQLWTALQNYYLDQRTPLEMSTRELRDSALALAYGGLNTQQMEVRLQFRYAIPLACLVFVLVAAPLGVRYAHLGSFAGIVLSILIVFLYNGVRSWGLAFGLAGDLSPIVAAWAQNAIFGAVGIWLYFSAR
jgi:lipopolysaccharide export system permease protein